MDLNREEFIIKYEEYVTKSLSAMEKGNYIVNNRYSKKLNKLNEKYKNEEYYIETLKELMDHSNLRIASIAAADSIRNKANIEKAIQTLERVSKTEGIGLTAFSAKWALKRWREEGTLD